MIVLNYHMKEFGGCFVVLGILTGISAFLVEPRVSITVVEHMPGVSGPIRLGLSPLLVVLALLMILPGLWMLFKSMGTFEKFLAWGSLASPRLRRLLLAWVPIRAWFRAKIAALRGRKSPPKAGDAKRDTESGTGFTGRISGRAKQSRKPVSETISSLKKKVNEWTDQAAKQTKELSKAAKDKLSKKLAEWKDSSGRN